MWFKHEGAFVHIISFILIASATTAAVAYQLPARGMSTASQPALTTALSWRGGDFRHCWSGWGNVLAMGVYCGMWSTGAGFRVCGVVEAL
eukprot:CAMPEP_0177759990 /NCGR_PEP_ID=MMETSP0491_2-20121128/5025_1 /TAXON_ID=63592 /ORGANISM="Tetraselmis chuii, Strain PLY429" /LENGTH=89 /DNA_ID=CAMNT_0019275853 /DNA_START=887 /DNA_END=1156 /DNA_ORIENTATION=-